MANEKTIKNRVTRQVKHTENSTEKFVLNLQRFFADNISTVIDKIKYGKVSAIEAANMIGGLVTDLQKNGLSKEIAKIKEIYADELQFISDELQEQGIEKPFSGTDKQVIDALINIGSSKATKELEARGVDVQASIMQQVIAGQAPDFKRLEKIDSLLAANLKTEINTAVMAFNSAVSAKKAEELGLDLFLYVGPDDGVTRDFCKDLLEKSPPIYTKDEIAKMDNGQKLSVQIYRGGYNCRHHWRPISRELARELGYRD